jgi:hypothetical protein
LIQRQTLFADSYSWGAGSCDSGIAVGGYHLESYEGESDTSIPVPNGGIRCIHSGSLSGSGVIVTIGRQRIFSDTQDVVDLRYDVDYEIQIYRLTSIFRGVLIRLSSSDSNTTDLTGKLYTTDPLLQMATTACATPTVAVGVTHRSAIDKDLVYATLRFESEQNESSVTNITASYNLEITVVGMNNDDGSVYAFSSYNIHVAGQASTTHENFTLVDSNGGYALSDDDVLPDSNTDDTSNGNIPLQNEGPNDNAPRDGQQSSSLVVGLATIVGGTCFIALFALVVRAKVHRSRVLNSVSTLTNTIYQ